MKQITNYRKQLSALLPLMALAIAAIFFTACTKKVEVKLGREAVQKKEWDKAVDFYIKAIGKDPTNIKNRLALSNALLSASNEHLKLGIYLVSKKKYNPALRQYEKALEFNPDNNEARNKKFDTLRTLRQIAREQRRKTEIEKLKKSAQKKGLKEPTLQTNRKPFSLKFINSDIKQIFKVMQKISGVNFIYDDSFKPKKIGINLQDVYFQDALQKITLQSKSFYKIIDSRTVMIIPDTPAKRKQFEELVMRTFYLSNAKPEELIKVVRSLTGIKSVGINKDLNALTVKAEPARVRLVEKIIRAHDKPKGELYIDIEIIEVNKSRLKDYGIELSSYQVGQAYSPVGSDSETGGGIRLNMVGHTDTSDYLLSIPTINYKLLKYDTKSQIKARPQLRVVDLEEVKVRLGDKVPIPTTSFVPYNTGGPAQQPITSYQLQDIGINITIKPRLHHDGLVTLAMEFELTFITVPGANGVPPTIGNRTVTSVIKLRDNETSILAGLLRDTERNSIRGFPFLSKVPVLKELFSANKKEMDQSDIILTVTPRIIRFPDIEAEDLEFTWAGTLLRPGLKSPTPELELNGHNTKKKKSRKKSAGRPAKKKPRAKPTAKPNKKKTAKVIPKPIKTAPIRKPPALKTSDKQSSEKTLLERILTEDNPLSKLFTTKKEK
ncbi:MAG: hypothetical protein GY765_17620 [bacterium]|nr:hypothetical protein [bacterium]